MLHSTIHSRRAEEADGRLPNLPVVDAHFLSQDPPGTDLRGGRILGAFSLYLRAVILFLGRVFAV